MADAEQFVTWDDAEGLPLRIYRTGDIGRRDRDGVLHFCGRSDRQVKVRGFRVEPAEIETVLALHPRVGQAVVTRAGSGHGAHLVGYVTTRSAAEPPVDLKAWLSARLPRYLVPDRFVVMETFPVTANGKVAIDLLPDGKNVSVHQPLQRPEGDEDENDAVATVARLARTILDYDGPIAGEDDVLDDLGGTSLALFQLLTAIEREFSCRIEIGRILADTTVAGLAALVDDGMGAPTPLVADDGTGPRPIYMIHAYLGTALNYRRLGPYLSQDRPLIGIQVQEFGDATGPVRTSIEEMAEEAVAQIRSRQALGPYVLGGHSAGGLVAYEAARELIASGDEVQLVVLLDSPVPRSSLHYLWAEAVLNWPDIRVADAAERIQQVRGALSRRFSHLRLHRDPDRVRATITHSYRAINVAVKRYHPGPYDGDVAVMRTKQGAAMALGKADLGWGELVRGRLVSTEIPGLHNTILEGPQLEIVGRQLDQLVARIGSALPAEVSPPSILPSFLRKRPAAAGRRRSA
ncbi:MAG: alpha/beta fold hydrolase [Acidimicrobiales bacterium]